MASLVFKMILKESVKNNFGQDDPYFEQVPATRLSGRPTTKTKRRRKANPPGLSEHDGKILTKVKRRAYRLDMCLFNCCGIRFGWSSVIGIVPAIGDVLDLLLSYMVINTCSKVEGGLPSSVKTKMVLNVILDFAVGLVPLIGDVADAAFRANTRNAALLEKYLREKGKKNLRASGVPEPVEDPSDPAVFDRASGDEPPPPQYTAQQPPREEPMLMSSSRTQTGRSDRQTPAQPAQARMRDDEPSRRGPGSFFSGRSRPDDIEMGRVGSDQGHTASAPKHKRLEKSQRGRRAG